MSRIYNHNDSKSGSSDKKVRGKSREAGKNLIKKYQKYAMISQENDDDDDDLSEDFKVAEALMKQRKKNPNFFKKQIEKCQKITNQQKPVQKVDKPKLAPKIIPDYEQPAIRMQVRHAELESKRQQRKYMQQKKVPTPIKKILKSQIHSPTRMQNLSPNIDKIKELKSQAQKDQKQALIYIEESKKIKEQIEKQIEAKRQQDLAFKMKEQKMNDLFKFKQQQIKLENERKQAEKMYIKFKQGQRVELISSIYRKSTLKLKSHVWSQIISYNNQISAKLRKFKKFKEYRSKNALFCQIQNYTRQQKIQRAEKEYIQLKQRQDRLKKDADSLYNNRLYVIAIRCFKRFKVISQKQREEEDKERQRQNKLSEFFEQMQERINNSKIMRSEQRSHTTNNNNNNDEILLDASFEQIKQQVSQHSPVRANNKNIIFASQQESISPIKNASLKTITQEENCQTDRELRCIVSPATRYRNNFMQQVQQEQQFQQIEEVKQNRINRFVKKVYKVPKQVLQMQKRQAERKKNRQQLQKRYQEKQNKKKQQEQQSKRQAQVQKKRLIRQKKKQQQEKKQKQRQLKQKQKLEKRQMKRKEYEADKFYEYGLMKRALIGSVSMVYKQNRNKQLQADLFRKKKVMRCGMEKIKSYLMIQQQIKIQKESQQIAQAITQYVFSLTKRFFYRLREHVMIREDERMTHQIAIDLNRKFKVFSKWVQLLPILRKQRIAIQRKQSLISSNFQRLFLQRKVLKSWVHAKEQQKKQRFIQQTKAKLWSKVNNWMGEMK